MFCSNCGKEISESSKFCPNCGKEVYSSTTSASTPPSMQPATGASNGGDFLKKSFSFGKQSFSALKNKVSEVTENYNSIAASSKDKASEFKFNCTKGIVAGAIALLDDGFQFTSLLKKEDIIPYDQVLECIRNLFSYDIYLISGDVLPLSFNGYVNGSMQSVFESFISNFNSRIAKAQSESTNYQSFMNSSKMIVPAEMGMMSKGILSIEEERIVFIGKNSEKREYLYKDYAICENDSSLLGEKQIKLVAYNCMEVAIKVRGTNADNVQATVCDAMDIAHSKDADWQKEHGSSLLTCRAVLYLSGFNVKKGLLEVKDSSILITSPTDKTIVEMEKILDIAQIDNDHSALLFLLNENGTMKKQLSRFFTAFSAEKLNTILNSRKLVQAEDGFKHSVAYMLDANKEIDGYIAFNDAVFEFEPINDSDKEKKVSEAFYKIDKIDDGGKDILQLKRLNGSTVKFRVPEDRSIVLLDELKKLVEQGHNNPLYEKSKKETFNPEEADAEFEAIKSSSRTIYYSGDDYIGYIESKGQFLLKKRNRRCRAFPASDMIEHRVHKERRKSIISDKYETVVYYQVSFRNDSGDVDSWRYELGASHRPESVARYEREANDIRLKIGVAQKDSKKVKSNGTTNNSDGEQNPLQVAMDSPLDDNLKKIKAYCEEIDEAIIKINKAEGKFDDYVEGLREKSLYDDVLAYLSSYMLTLALCDDYNNEMLGYIDKACGSTWLEKIDGNEESVDNYKKLALLTAGLPMFITTTAMADMYEKGEYIYLTAIGVACNFIKAFPTDARLEKNEELFEEVKHKLNGLAMVGYAKYQGLEDEDDEEEVEDVNKDEQEDDESEDLDSLLDNLQNMIGLASAKEEVSSLINLVKVNEMRKKRGLDTTQMSMHLVFTGNPGTGKTSVARILAAIYKQLGVLSKGQLVEVDRSGLVAGYVGQTAIKTSEVIESALGGILFIDEAYTLANDSENDYGKEAIDTLLKAMEDHRDDFVVIVAGYTDRINEFLGTNPGLRSRFNHFVHFEDYTSEELTKIYLSISEGAGYKVDEKATAKIGEYFKSLCENKDDSFANGRTARNFFEKTVSVQANRISQMKRVTDKALVTISSEDIDNATNKS